MENKKICIVQNSLSYGGTDTFVINLSRGLVKDGHDVTVVLSVDQDSDLPRLNELISTGAKIVWTCSLNGLKSKFNHFKLLYKELKKEKYDVFQTNIDLFNGLQMFVAWLAGVPVRECHSHNSQQGRELQEGKSFSVKVYQGIMRWLCWTFSNRRGGCSAIAMDFLFRDKWKTDSNSKVVHNGIDLFKYKKPFDLVAKKREELGLTQKYHICTVGRISYQKNPLFIVEVLNELFKFRDDCDFVWVGTGDMEDQVKSIIEDNDIQNRMHLLGNRNDVHEILPCCDLFFLPSYFEGLGIVLIEAQAVELPCVVSDVVPGEVNCGACLPVALNQSASYWAQQLSDVLDGRIELKVDPARLNEYSIDHMVSQMEGLFEA